MRSRYTQSPIHPSHSGCSATSRTGRRWLVSLALFGSLLGGLLGTPAAQAQTAGKLRLERFGFEKLPDLKVYLTFVEEDGTVIAGRAASDFKLLLDAADQGAANAVTTFEQSKEPVYVVAVVQASGAVTERALTEVKNGLRRIGEVVGTSGGRMGVLSYATATNRLIEGGTSTEVDSAINKISIDGEASETHMIDAVRTAIDLLKAQDKGRRKVIVVFSDGIDVNNDKKLFADIGNRAQQAGITIDTVGYNEFDPSKLRNLVEMAKRCYGIDRLAKAPSEIGPRLDAIVDELQKQYVVTFPLAISGDDKEHTFQVTHEAGGRPVYSNAVNEKLPSKAPTPTVRPTEKGGRWWLWLLLGGGVLAAIGAVLALRKKPQPVAEQPSAPLPMSAPMPTHKANKTVALEAAGDITMGWMMGLTGKYKDQTFKLKDRTVVGTAADCDVVIEDGFMSGRHCEIRKVDGGFKLVDLGATNGVIVNDKRVKEHFLVDNDNFRLGRTEFKFKSIFS
jgi:hypothetical protein